MNRYSYEVGEDDLYIIGTILRKLYQKNNEDSYEELLKEENKKLEFQLRRDQKIIVILDFPKETQEKIKTLFGINRTKLVKERKKVSNFATLGTRKC